MADDRNFQLSIITPDRVFYKGDAYFVEFNTTEGEVGIYKNHIPMTFIVKPGILTIHEEGETKEAALHAGFVEVLGDKITIMAEIVEWPSEIDEGRAQAAMERAKERISQKDNATDYARAETALARAVARIEVLK